MKSTVYNIIKKYKSVRMDDFGTTANIVKTTNFKGNHCPFEVCIAQVIGEDLYMGGVKSDPYYIDVAINHWNNCKDIAAQLFDAGIKYNVFVSGKIPYITFPEYDGLSITCSGNIYYTLSRYKERHPVPSTVVPIMEKYCEPQTIVQSLMDYLEEHRQWMDEYFIIMAEMGCEFGRYGGMDVVTVPGTTLSATITPMGNTNVRQNSMEISTHINPKRFIEMVKSVRQYVCEIPTKND